MAQVPAVVESEPRREVVEAATAVAPKKCGRPKGLGKAPGSGRRKGVANRSTEVGRDFISQNARDIKFLCDVSAGKLVSVADPDNPRKKLRIYPSLADRLLAARITAPMHVATLKSVELTAGEKAPFVFQFISGRGG